ncbi:hypothetical protein BGX34_002938, partial [Mortierella sp. NVP85]
MRTTAITTTAILWLSGIASIALLPIVNAGVTCQGGNFTADFYPGVTFQKKNIHGSTLLNDLGVCQSADFPKITRGILDSGADGPGVCTGPLVAGNGRFEIRWNDGSRSQGSHSLTVELANWYFNGVVSTGSFAGKTVRANGRGYKSGS